MHHLPPPPPPPAPPLNPWQLLGVSTPQALPAPTPSPQPGSAAAEQPDSAWPLDWLVRSLATTDASPLSLTSAAAPAVHSPLNPLDQLANYPGVGVATHADADNVDEDPA
ncbi:hypothetical protein HK405_007613, partial [Cladochytrium tenue]